MALTLGVGFTVMVEFELLPAHVTPALVKDGMTPMVAVSGVDPGFVAGNGAMFPDPELPKPIDVLEFVQAYEVPVPLMVIKELFVPLQKVVFERAVTTGIGFTVMVNVCALPGQVTLLLVNCGVTVTVEVTMAELEGLRAANAVIFPVPLAARPIEVRLFAQVYEVPVPEKATGAVLVLWHTTWFAGAVTAGVGFTVMV